MIRISSRGLFFIFWECCQKFHNKFSRNSSNDFFKRYSFRIFFFTGNSSGDYFRNFSSSFPQEDVLQDFVDEHLKKKTWTHSCGNNQCILQSNYLTIGELLEESLKEYRRDFLKKTMDEYMKETLKVCFKEALLIIPKESLQEIPEDFQNKSLEELLVESKKSNRKSSYRILWGYS